VILPIITYPNKTLRTPGKDVKFPASASVRKLVKDMTDTVRHAKGIGLAAPQVGHSLNVIVVDLEHMGLPIFAMLNPRIIATSKKSTKMEEGCLSLPGVYGIVSRPQQITFSGYSIEGKKMEFDADELLAKVLQHETDHVNGVLIIDKITKYTEGRDLIGEKPLI
jgi:peptide deformylase